jgi:hypothetical protein
VNGLVAFQARKGLDGSAGFLLREAEVVKSLEIEPELGAGAKEMSEPQSCVARDGARPMQDLRDSVGRHVELSRECGGAHIECFQFFGELFPWMDSCDGHDGSPSDSPQFRRLKDRASGRATRNKSATDH